MANFQYSIASHISESFPSAEILKRPKSVTVIGLSLPVTLKGIWMLDKKMHIYKVLIEVTFQ